MFFNFLILYLKTLLREVFLIDLLLIIKKNDHVVKLEIITL